MHYNTPLIFFKYIQGPWKISRTITSNNKQIATGEGSAYFITHDFHNLIYKEDLTIILSASTYKCYLASKQYKYCLEDNSLIKYFVERDGGGVFYQLNFNNFVIFGKHICNKDSYAALYHVLDKNHFILNYVITGPEKNHSITTNYTRMVDNPVQSKNDL